MLVALEAALGGAVDGQRYVFGITEAADVDGLAAGFQRTALAHAGQGLQQAGDVIGLVAVDVGLGQGRAVDGARVDVVTGAYHAEGVELDRAAVAGFVFGGAHDVSGADSDQAELAVFQQGANRHFRGERTVECRCLRVLEQRFIEQQLDFRLLRHLAQRGGQRLGGQLQRECLGLRTEAERQAAGNNGRSKKQVQSVARRAKHGIPRGG